MTRQELINAIVESKSDIDPAILDKIANARKKRKRPSFTKLELRQLGDGPDYSGMYGPEPIPYYDNPYWVPRSRRKRYTP